MPKFAALPREDDARLVAECADIAEFRKPLRQFLKPRAALHKLPLPEFYKELVETQCVLSRKHLRWAALRQCAGIVVRLLLRGQTNFLRMLWKFNSVYNPELQVADHDQPARYQISLPPASTVSVDPGALYIHQSRGRTGRQIDRHTEEFVNATHMGDAA